MAVVCALIDKVRISIDPNSPNNVNNPNKNPRSCMTSPEHPSDANTNSPGQRIPSPAPATLTLTPDVQLPLHLSSSHIHIQPCNPFFKSHSEISINHRKNSITSTPPFPPFSLSSNNQLNEPTDLQMVSNNDKNDDDNNNDKDSLISPLAQKNDHQDMFSLVNPSPSNTSNNASSNSNPCLPATSGQSQINSTHNACDGPSEQPSPNLPDLEQEQEQKQSDSAMGTENNTSHQSPEHKDRISMAHAESSIPKEAARQLVFMVCSQALEREREKLVHGYQQDMVMLGHELTISITNSSSDSASSRSPPVAAVSNDSHSKQEQHTHGHGVSNDLFHVIVTQPSIAFTSQLYDQDAYNGVLLACVNVLLRHV